MLAFLDESGEAGVSGRPGSSDYFVVGLVLFDSDQQAAAADNRIVSLRSSLSLPASFEFKFNKLSRPLRLAFLDDVAGCDFSYFGAIIDKTAIQPTEAALPFQKAIEVLFQLVTPSLQANTTLVMDGDGNRYLQRELKAAIRKTVGVPGRIQSSSSRTRGSTT